MIFTVDQLKTIMRCISARVHTRNINDPIEKAELDSLLTIFYMINDEIKLAMKRE